MNSRIILSTFLIFVFGCCLAFGQDGQTTNPAINPNCPVQRTMGFMGNLLRSFTNGLGNGANSIRNGASSLTSPSTVRRRRKRQINDLTQPVAQPTIITDGGRVPQLAQPPSVILPPPPLQPSTGITTNEQQVISYNSENMQNERYNLQRLMRHAMQSPYMPSREQMVQILTAILTLVLVSFVGPAAGANYGVITAIIKQILPFLVAAVIQFAADQANSPEQQQLQQQQQQQTNPALEAPITNVQLQPVQASSQPAIMGNF